MRFPGPWRGRPLAPAGRPHLACRHMPWRPAPPGTIGPCARPGRPPRTAPRTQRGPPDPPSPARSRDQREVSRIRHDVGCCRDQREVDGRRRGGREWTREQVGRGRTAGAAAGEHCHVSQHQNASHHNSCSKPPNHALHVIAPEGWSPSSQPAHTAGRPGLAAQRPRPDISIHSPAPGGKRRRDPGAIPALHFAVWELPHQSTPWLCTPAPPRLTCSPTGAILCLGRRWTQPWRGAPPVSHPVRHKRST